jgi:hypothetical protein
VAEARRLLAAMSDDALEGALRDLGSAIEFPSTAAAGSAGSAGRDVAAQVLHRIEAAPPRRGPLDWLRARPVRRSLLVAVAALLILAAVAGAVGLGLPGIRIIFGGPTPVTPTASPSAPASGATARPIGQGMGLGTRVSLADAARRADLDLVLPADPSIGPPDAAFLLANRVALVWGERPGLPVDASSGVALLLNEFRGSVDEGYYTKLLDTGTRVRPVTVGGSPGYWIDGPPHFFFYTDPSGAIVDDARRVVGDTLIWTDGAVTYRLESQLEMADAISFAESLR